jgi:phosphoglycolate phosphatase-like HAD superfamily hydrolase
MVEHPKPDPEMVLKAVELLGRPKHEVLYIGDMSLDVETCRRAGVAACLVPGGSDSREALLAARPDHLIERFDQLPGLVRD